MYVPRPTLRALSVQALSSSAARFFFAVVFGLVLGRFLFGCATFDTSMAPLTDEDFDAAPDTLESSSAFDGARDEDRTDADRGDTIGIVVPDSGRPELASLDDVGPDSGGSVDALDTGKAGDDAAKSDSGSGSGDGGDAETLTCAPGGTLGKGAFCTVDSYWCCEEAKCCGKCVHTDEASPAWGHCT